MMSLPMVLIIDDDFFSNAIIKIMLEDNRVNNDTAISVEFALQLIIARIESNAPMYKIIFLDYMMQGKKDETGFSI